MEVFDETVHALANAGVMVVLNNHISDAIWCCGEDDGNGLWHNESYSTADWIQSVRDISDRYKDIPMVVAHDLRNEIRYDKKNNLTPEWGTGNKDVDWKWAAITAGNEVLRVTPDQLIIVEGLSYAYDMSPIKTSPIELNKPNKLVYSFHYYDW